MLKNTDIQWGSLSRAFHVVMAFGIIAMFCGGYYMQSLAKTDPMRAWLHGLHKQVGIVLLLLACMRLIWRFLNVIPKLTDFSPGMKKLARMGHGLMYVFMISVPLSGWVMASAADKPPSFFGIMFQLPVGEAYKHLAHDTHEILNQIWWVMVLGHALFGLYHGMKNPQLLKRMFMNVDES